MNEILALECLHKAGAVTATDCHRLSADRQHNEECVALGCPSKWRVCRVCVLHGTVDLHSRVMDSDMDLCVTHIDQGEEHRKGEEILSRVLDAQSKKKLHTPSSKTKQLVVSKSTSSTLQKVLVSAMQSASNPTDVRTDEIRRFECQPRILFDEQSLCELGESLNLFQVAPILLRKLKPNEIAKSEPKIRYELVDGERRWRACKAVGKKIIRAVFISVPNKEVQFAISAIANFGRKDHTPIEEAFAIRFMREELKLEMVEIGKAFAKSQDWVYKRASLLRLHSDVQKMLNPTPPKEKQLSVAIATQLAGYPDQDFQLRVAQEILSHDMGLRHAQVFIKREAKAAGKKSMRKPKDGPLYWFRILHRFVDNVFPRLENLLTLPEEHISKIFPDHASRIMILDNLEKISRKLEALIRRLNSRRR